MQHLMRHIPKSAFRHHLKPEGQLTEIKSKPVRIYSPLHNVSEHFVDRLSESLCSSGLSSVRLESESGEVGSNLPGKALSFVAHVKNVRRHVREGGPNVVAWPLLGWWEIPLWRHDRHRTLIAVHDPEPLVHQYGISPSSAKASARLSGSHWPHIVVMSPEAQSITLRYFEPRRVHLAPHPMRAPTPREQGPHSGIVLVLGQYKPARDLDVMAAVGPALVAAGWQPVVAGRGWPAIPGWNVLEGFLSEAEFTRLLESAAVVALPYRYYFQSGVALRALEAGVPVVGRETGFLASVLGRDFPGAVHDWDSPQEWLAAVEAAVESAPEQARSARAYQERGTAEWHDLVTGAEHS